MNQKQKLILFPFIMIFYEATVFLANDMYLPSMPAIARDLSLSEAQLQLTLTGWFLGASALQVILGPLSDRYGRKKLLVIGGIIYVISSIVCAITSSLTVMLIARVIQGTAICSLIAGYAAIHELYNTKQAIKLITLIASVTVIAPALGPLLGSIVVQFASWRYIFWFLAVMGIISSWLMWFYMPDSNHPKQPLKIKAITKDFKDIILNKHFLLPCFCYCLLMAVFFLWMFESPFMIINLFGKSTLYYGASQAAIFACFFIAAKVTDWFLDRHSVRSLVIISAAISAAGAVLFLLGALVADSLMFGIISMMVLSVGASLLFGPLNRIAIEACKQPMGARTAVFSTMNSLAGVFAGILASRLQKHSLLELGELITLCTLIAIILIRFINFPKSLRAVD